ncbi:MAG TPA: FMN-binding protein [Feifaniaceae bacterium]|nr:FMN-binding protein [Feifaniaceae bacterium]
MKKIALILAAALMLAVGFACTTTPEVTPSPQATGVPSPAGETAPPDNVPEASPGGVPEASPGTGMTASAKGYGGDVTATLTLTGGNIDTLTLSGPDETEGVGKAAIETYNKALAEFKGRPLSEFDPSALDAVSGATVTSTAAKTALQDVIGQAG